MRPGSASLAMLFAVLVSLPIMARAADTLDGVRKAGTLSCGVVVDVDDYSEADTHGDLSALGLDYCRAMAAAILGDPRRVRVDSLPDEPTALAALRNHRIDVLFGATPDPILGALYRLRFGPPLLLDGQGFLVARRLGIGSASGLGGHDVCFINGSPAEQRLYDGLEPMLATPERRFPYSERGEMEIALLGGHCDAVTGDLSWLATIRASFGRRAAEFVILPETVTTDPFSPAMRDDDPRWASLVDWTVWSLLQAETHGIAHADAARTGTTTVARRLLGATPWIGKALGIADAGFAQAIRAVGNAGEIYDRDVGEGSRLGLPRGRNRPVEQGGVLWALPVEPLQ